MSLLIDKNNIRLYTISRAHFNWLCILWLFIYFNISRNRQGDNDDLKKNSSFPLLGAQDYFMELMVLLYRI